MFFLSVVFWNNNVGGRVVRNTAVVYRKLKYIV